MSKTAVVLLNLGAPDCLSAVEPFLYNLFRDPAILTFRAPQFVRNFIAKVIAKRRTPIAQHIYQHLGGKSPLYENTLAQALKLQEALGSGYSVHVAMRYWHPMTEQVIQSLKASPPSEIILMPLYPQFSTTTSQSSLSEWRAVQSKMGLDVPLKHVCCYPEAKGFVKAQVELLNEAMSVAAKKGAYRILFSAHGLPQRIVDAGDPYPNQVEATATAIMSAVSSPGNDWRICFQSRVGPVTWLKPYADQEIREAGRENKGVVLVPLSFVSEHSETLVELDLEFRLLAEASGVPFYERVPTVGIHPAFIEALKEMVLDLHKDTAPSLDFSYFCKRACEARCGSEHYA